MASSDLRDKITSLEALINSDGEHAAIALERLQGLVDADSTCRKLHLLLQLQRIEEAKAEINLREPEPEWLEIAIRIGAISGDMPLVARLLSAADFLEDRTGTLRLRAATAFLEGALLKHTEEWANSQTPRFRYAVSPDTRAVLSAALDRFSGFQNAIAGRRETRSKLEKDALTAATLALALINRIAEAAVLAAVLTRTPPVDVELGRFAIDGRLPNVPNLAEALRSAERDDLEAQLLGLLLQEDAEKDLPGLFHRLTQLVPSARTSLERVLLFSILSQTAHQLGYRAKTVAKNVASRLLDLSDADHRRAAADQAARDERWDEARNLLQDGDQSNPLAKWTLGQCDIAQGRTDFGLSSLIEAALAFLNDRWLLEAAQRANEAKREAECVACLESLRDYFPWQLSARKVLAQKLWNAGRSQDAITELETLSATPAADEGTLTFLARAYLQTDKPERALEALSALDSSAVAIASSDVPILHALVLRRLERPADAFAILDGQKTNFWADTRFLLAFIETAYAAGKEEEAHKALVALNTLREEGRVDPNHFRLGSLDELIQISRQQQERRKTTNAALIRCQIPWTLASEAFRNAVIWDWMIRTQEIKWLSEEETSRAEYSIYATNGFAINQSGTERNLEEIGAAQTDTVCIDYSALITLHELGLLTALFEHYRSVLIPAEYRLSVLEDTRRLQPHQLSLRHVTESLHRLIQLQRINVAEPAQELARIDEYTDSDETGTRRIAALIDGASRAGRIDTDTAVRLRRLPWKTEAHADALPLGSAVQVELLTLKSLHQEKILEAVTNSFRVFISEEDRATLSNEIRTYEFQDLALSKLRSLWKTIEEHSSIEFVARKALEADADPIDSIALDSFRLATNRNVPLLADDRALQTVVTNTSGTTHAAFGTSEVISALWKSRALALDRYADAFMKLITWRYKFLIPAAEVLLHFAKKYENSTPGRELAAIAHYSHDCMADPGLLGGLENSTPPSSMALKLYIGWYARIGEFLAMLWTDPDTPMLRRESITEWVANTMLPSVPTSIDERYHEQLARQVREITITSALLNTVTPPQSTEVSSLLLILSRGIGLSQRRLFQLYLEVAERALA